MGQEMGLLELRQGPHLPHPFPLWSPAWGRAQAPCAWVEQGPGGAGLKCGGQSSAERSEGPLLSPQKPPLCSLVSGDLLPNPQAAHPDTVGEGTLSESPRNVPTVLLWESPGQVWDIQVCRVIANGFGRGGGGGR